MPDNTSKKPTPDKSSTSKVEDLKKPISDRDAQAVKGGVTNQKK